jgi:nucleobase:cation symporter-1, NCS1 family
VIGIAVQIPFAAQEFHKGALVDDLGGADISWLVGLVVTTTIYYLWARKTSNPPTQMLYPADSGIEATEFTEPRSPQP